jgi:hypothetical protein
VTRIEFIGLPGGDDVFEAELRRVSVFLDVIFVLRFGLDIHPARIPVAILGGGLRAPVVPDAKLRVTKLVWHLVGVERFPRREKWPSGRSGGGAFAASERGARGGTEQRNGGEKFEGGAASELHG